MITTTNINSTGIATARMMSHENISHLNIIKTVRQSDQTPSSYFEPSVLSPEKLEMVFTTGKGSSRRLLDFIRNKKSNMDDYNHGSAWLKAAKDDNPDIEKLSRVKRIVGGHKVKSLPQPMVAVKYEQYVGQVSTCGGTMIGNKHVLTAAHCANSNVPYKVCHGTLLRDQMISKGQKTPPVRCYKVNKITLHPSYNQTAVDINGDHNGDLAILELEKNFVGTNHCAMPLPSDRVQAQLKEEKVNWNWNNATTESNVWNCISMGWGTHARGWQSRKLKRVELHNVQNKDYSNGLQSPHNGTVKCSGDNTVCAGNLGPAKTLHFSNKTVRATVCKGDSGGPLFYVNKGASELSLVGVVSSGPTVCGYHAPASFASVGYYTDWISNITGAVGKYCETFRYMGTEYSVPN